ncbi:MAG: hypothetical protein KF803_06585 [Cyclobacteriaceae bacterium]|nr:hypothetical protein [Cyclobacteriaceae bacterium]
MQSLRLAILLILGAPAIAQTPDHPFAWLEGTWKRPDKQVFEVWKKGEGEILLQGIAFRISPAGDTLITEEIKFVREDAAYFYIPDVAGPQGPIRFKLTAFDATSFVAENPDHDFPKMIAYEYQPQTQRLMASISGDGKSIPFPFERVNPSQK